jgi:hypothetical protein
VLIKPVTENNELFSLIKKIMYHISYNKSMTRNIIKNAWKLLSLLLVCATAVGFTSCGDDDDDDDNIINNGSNTSTTTQYKDIVVEYAASAGEGYTSFWNVEVKYTNESGTTTTAQVDANGWSYSYHVDPSKAPSTFVFALTGQVNANAPTPDDATVYSMAHSYKVHIRGIKADGSEVTLAGWPNPKGDATLSTDGTHIKNLMGESKRIVSETSFSISL